MAFKWLASLIKSQGLQPKKVDGIDLNRAIAVLMLEVVQSDFSETIDETQTVLAALISHTQKSEQEAGALLAAAQSEKANSAGLYEFTRLACSKMSMENRCSLVKQLWQIAYGDGIIDKYEEAAIRKVAELLYVPHTEFIKAKIAATNSQTHS